MTEFSVWLNNYLTRAIIRGNKESQKKTKAQINLPRCMPLFSWWTFSVPYFLNRLVLMLHHPQRSVPTWSHARQYPSVSFWHTEHRLSELHFPPTTESIQNQHFQSSHFKRGGETYMLGFFKSVRQCWHVVDCAWKS